MGFFDVETRLVLSHIAKILGKDDDNAVDKLVLGMFSMMMTLGMVLYIPSYWQEAVNSQLMSLSLTGSFKFPSLIVYFLLYQIVEEFMHLGLNIMDVNKRRQLVIFSIDVVRREKNEARLFDFSGYYMPTAYKY